MSGKKTTKVLELKVVHPDPNPDVVAIARDFLARAESGETQCVVLVMDCNGDFISWTKTTSCFPASNS